MGKVRQAQGILLLAECTGLSPVANSFVCWSLSWISRVHREWECPTLPSLALVPPERLSVSCEHDIESCCLSWLHPALWFQFLVSIFRCVGSFPSSERDCFSDFNYHLQNLGKKGLCAIACFSNNICLSHPSYLMTSNCGWSNCMGKRNGNNNEPLHSLGGNLQLHQEKPRKKKLLMFGKVEIRADDYFSISHKRW